MKKTALILAGGRGERFWPKSRQWLPKQFLSLTGDGKTMIQLTVERIAPLVDIHDIFIVTNESYRHIVKEQLPYLPNENILCEPVRRNTAPCIGLGAEYIASRYGDALMMVLPSDHLIQFESIFRHCISYACDVAEQGDNLVTLGITPNEPETGYGYIKFYPDRTLGGAYEVERFVEKPNLETAREYLASREYLWNSGMFIWKASTILSNIRTYLPDLYEGLEAIRKAFENNRQEAEFREIFSNFQSISIDYGIMEKAKNIYTVPGTFGWDDVGSWLAVSRIQKANEFGNAVFGKVVSFNTRNCIIQGSDKLIATIGLNQMIVVDTEDVLLICNKENAGEIKQVLEYLKQTDQTSYL